MPGGLANFQSMVLRYNNRTMIALFGFSEDYPPFDFTTTAADPGGFDDVEIEFTPALEDRSRLSVGLRFFYLIPQVIVFWFVSIGAFFVLLIAWFAVLFTGRWPNTMKLFILGWLRWGVRLSAYAAMLTDEYPPFSLD